YLAIGTAILLWLAWPPIPFSAPLLWFALVPLLFGVEQLIRQNTPKLGRKIFWLCFLAMFLWNTGSIYWVYHSIAQVMPVYAAIPVSLIPFSLAAFLMAASFWIYYRLRRQHRIYLALLGFSGVWVCY